MVKLYHVYMYLIKYNVEFILCYVLVLKIFRFKFIKVNMKIRIDIRFTYSYLKLLSMFIHNIENKKWFTYKGY